MISTFSDVSAKLSLGGKYWNRFRKILGPIPGGAEQELK